MDRQIRKIAWMASVAFFLALMAGCAFRDQAAFEQRIEKMSDAEVIAAYKGINERLKTIDKKIQKDQEEMHKSRVVKRSPDMDAYFSSGYVDLHAKEKRLLEEMKKRRLSP